MGKQPLYPHVPKGRKPETPSGGELKPGTKVRLKSGTEGWIQGSIVEYIDIWPESRLGFSPLGAVVYTGPHYRVYILQGKHKGETLTMPIEYIEIDTSELP